ncbi:MAG: hypothetical protein WBN57_08425 [Gammaproteobacteria bacterium]
MSTSLSLLAGMIPVIYLALFLFSRQPATLRFGRFGWILIAMTGFIVLALEVGDGATETEMRVLLALLVLSVALIATGHVWIFRMDEEKFRESIRDACRRLLLPFEESTACSGFILMESSQVIKQLRLLMVCRGFVLVLLPCRSGRGKVELLRSWLSKQYPGPVPRIHIFLKEKNT